MLKDKNMCRIVLRLLMNMYANQKIYVRLNNLLLLSVYGPFSDRVGLHLHNIPSPFLYIVDIFFVDLKFFHIRFYTLYPWTSWSSNRSSAFNSIHFFTQ